MRRLPSLTFGRKSKPDKIRSIKGVFNVDTTTMKNPREIMEEVMRVLGDQPLEVLTFFSSPPLPSLSPLPSPLSPPLSPLSSLLSPLSSPNITCRLISTMASSSVARARRRPRRARPDYNSKWRFARSRVSR